MNTIAAVTVAPELVATATPMRPEAPPREAIEPPGRPLAEARRADGRGACAEEGPRDFATALADEMEPGDAESAPVHAGRKPRANPPPADEHGEDAPPTGNGLPPWLVGLPPATLPANAAPAAVAALETTGPAERPSAALAAGPNASPLPETPATPTPPAPLVDAAATADATLASAIEPPAADAALGADLLADAPDAVPLPNGKTLPAQPRADGPSPAEAALQHSARFAAAPSAAERGDALPASASDVARQVAQAIGRQAASRPPVADAGLPPVERRVATGAPVAMPATPVVEAPVTPLLQRAVSAALAADGEPSTELAATIPQSPSLAAALPTPATPAAAAGAPVLQIPVAVGAPDWDRQLGERVGVLVDQGLTNAQLKLSPAHLGPLEIRISVQNDQANVWFGTHSHATREALEAAAPRLRDMLGAQGFANVGVSVDLQQQASRQNAPSSRYEPEFSFAAGGIADADAPRAGATRSREADRSRLDAFA